MNYETKNNILTESCLWAIAENGLIIKSETTDRFLSWKEINQIRLRYAPTRYVANRFTCELQTTHGDKIWFSSHYFKGFANFEDQTRCYKEFVMLLIQKLMLNNNSCQFVSGAGNLNYYFNLLVMIFSAFLLVVILNFIFLLGLPWLAIFKLFLIFYYTPRAIKWLQVSKMKNFNPQEIPVGLLPK